ncbi:MAG: flagellar hook-length control protein FliK [Halanaerobiales bacterium]
MITIERAVNIIKNNIIQQHDDSKSRKRTQDIMENNYDYSSNFRNNFDSSISKNSPGESRNKVDILSDISQKDLEDKGDLEEINDKFSNSEKKQIKNILNLLVSSSQDQKQLLESLSDEDLKSLKQFLDNSLEEFLEEIGLDYTLSTSEIENLKDNWEVLKLNFISTVNKRNINLEEISLDEDIREDLNLDIMKLFSLSTPEKLQKLSHLSSSEIKQLQKLMDEVYQSLKNSGILKEVNLDLEQDTKKLSQEEIELINELNLEETSSSDLKSLVAGFKKLDEIFQKLFQRLTNKEVQKISSENIFAGLKEVNNKAEETKVHKLAEYYFDQIDADSTDSGKEPVKNEVINLKENQEILTDLMDNMVESGELKESGKLFTELINKADDILNLHKISAEKNQDNYKIFNSGNDLISSLKISDNEKKYNRDQLLNKIFYNSENGLKSISEKNATGNILNQGFSNNWFLNSNNFNQSNIYNTSTAAVRAELIDQITNQVHEQIRFVHQSGSNQMNIELEPEFLGRLNLDIQVDSGEVTAKFLVENLFVKNHLEENISLLETNLSRAGLDIDKIEIETSNNIFQEEPESDFQDGSGQGEENNSRNQNNFWQQNKYYNETSLKDIMELEDSLKKAELKRWLVLNQYYNGLNYLV